MSASQAPATPGASSDDDGSSRRGLTPVPLVRAAHPRRAVLTAAAMAVGAAASGRPTREVALVLVTVIAGQAVLGWDNDLVDEDDDRAADRAGKPLATGALDRGTVWFAVSCAVLLVVPLSLSSGFEAGTAYLLSLLMGVLGNRRLEWKCDAANAPSRRAAERFGFVYEGVFRQHRIVKGRNRDTAWYSITDSEWPSRRAAFEAWLAPSNFDTEGRQRQPLEAFRGI